MSLFNELNLDDPITPEFLKGHKFQINYWGSPKYDSNAPGKHRFYDCQQIWEKIVFIYPCAPSLGAVPSRHINDYTDSIIVTYFPSGYSGGCLAFCNSRSSNCFISDPHDIILTQFPTWYRQESWFRKFVTSSGADSPSLLSSDLQIGGSDLVFKCKNKADFLSILFQIQNLTENIKRKYKKI